MNIGFKILTLIAVSICIIGLCSITKTIIIKYKGSKITATVTHVDSDCDRYNKIQVEFKNKTYEISISKNNCRDKVYKLGQKVTLIKYKNYDELVWPESKIEWVLPLIIGVGILAYYTNKK